MALIDSFQVAYPQTDKNAPVGRSRKTPPPEISSVIYSSHATSLMSRSELHKILQQARARNHAESITGLVIYENGAFFQWLEGPASSLQRIMRSINNDKRHTDMRILGATVANTRLFADWDLKLATGSADFDALEPDAIYAPPGTVETLDQHPETARSLLTRLSSKSSLPDQPIIASAETQDRQGKPSSAGLRNLIETAILPRLLAKHIALEADGASRAVENRGQELALLLIQDDPSAAFDLIAAIQSKGANSIVAVSASLFESAARSLGDLWHDDACSSVDMTLGMSRLQFSVRRMRTDLLPSVLANMPLHSVLVSPQPGEPHILRAMLDSEVLLQAGWEVQSEFPETDRELASLVAKTSFDALDLTLSAAFLRENWLPRMAETIANVRGASRNPGLLILVGGRVFGDTPDGGLRVGADGSSTSALDAERLMRDQLLHSR